MKRSANPFLEMDMTKLTADMTKLMGGMKLPGVDAAGMVESQRRNIEALTAANNLAVEGMQAVAKRQAEILRASLEEMTKASGELMTAGGPEDAMAKQAEMTKRAFAKAITNMRELAELVAKSNNEACDVINKRVAEGLDELRDSIKHTK
jgi:phasin family protein